MRKRRAFADQQLEAIMWQRECQQACTMIGSQRITLPPSDSSRLTVSEQTDVTKKSDIFRLNSGNLTQTNLNQTGNLEPHRGTKPLSSSSTNFAASVHNIKLMNTVMPRPFVLYLSNYIPIPPSLISNVGTVPSSLATSFLDNRCSTTMPVQDETSSSSGSPLSYDDDTVSPVESPVGEPNHTRNTDFSIKNLLES